MVIITNLLAYFVIGVIIALLQIYAIKHMKKEVLNTIKVYLQKISLEINVPIDDKIIQKISEEVKEKYIKEKDIENV